MRILPALFGVILIPPAVAHEAISVNLESWIEIRSLQQEIPPTDSSWAPEWLKAGVLRGITPDRLSFEELVAEHVRADFGIRDRMDSSTEPSTRVTLTRRRSRSDRTPAGPGAQISIFSIDRRPSGVMATVWFAGTGCQSEASRLRGSEATITAP